MKGQDKKEYVRRTAKIAKLGDKLWDERKMEMAVPGKRKRGRPRRSWTDLMREDMERVGAREGDLVDRVKWRIFSRCGDPE